MENVDKYVRLLGKACNEVNKRLNGLANYLIARMFVRRNLASCVDVQDVVDKFGCQKNWVLRRLKT